MRIRIRIGISREQLLHQIYNSCSMPNMASTPLNLSSSSRWRRVARAPVETPVSLGRRHLLTSMNGADPRAPRPSGGAHDADATPRLFTAGEPASPLSHLLSLDDAADLSRGDVLDLIDRHLVPRTTSLFRRVGFDRRILRRAEGMYYFDDADRAILDFFGGFGTMALGHNHPRLLAARQRFGAERWNDMSLMFPSPFVAALSHNLAELSPRELEIVLLCQSGSEATELALRLGEHASRRGGRVAYATGAFHGKTRGSLSVSDEAIYRRGVTLPSGRVRVPFGDADALRRAFVQDRKIGVLIIETVQGGAGIVLPPSGYLEEVRLLCDHYGVLWVADEVQCGMGRSGRFYAFEHSGAVPDIVTLAKALGGGKAPIGAVIARSSVFDALPRNAKAALRYGPSTFAWLGENCATAVETLNVLVDEDLVGRAEMMGRYLLNKLRVLQERYPDLIIDVRGIGCMVGIEFASAPPLLERAGVRLAGAISGPVGSLMFNRHDVLAGFTSQNKNVLRLEPPLIVGTDHIDRFCEALSLVLDRGGPRIVLDFLSARRPPNGR